MRGGSYLLTQAAGPSTGQINMVFVLLLEFTRRLHGCVWISGMSGFLTTPQHKNKISYWVLNKWYLHKKVKNKYVYIKN